MERPSPVLTASLFRPLDAALIALLRGLTADDWSKPTAAPRWSVHDVAAHLLDTAMRRLSAHRDRYEAPLPPDAFANGLGAFVNNSNREWVDVAKKYSPAVLVDLLELIGAQLSSFFESLDPFSPAQWPVSWAGEEESLMWFDVAREFTERWHHQQQIRDAVGASPLYDGYLAPVIDTFVRALPFALRDAGDGVVRFTVTGAGSWLVADGTLYLDDGSVAATSIEMSGDTAWRLFTKGLTRDAAALRTTIEGRREHGEAVLAMICIVG